MFRRQRRASAAPRGIQASTGHWRPPACKRRCCCACRVPASSGFGRWPAARRPSPMRATAARPPGAPTASRRSTPSASSGVEMSPRLPGPLQQCQQTVGRRRPGAPRGAALGAEAQALQGLPLDVADPFGPTPAGRAVGPAAASTAGAGPARPQSRPRPRAPRQTRCRTPPGEPRSRADSPSAACRRGGHGPLSQGLAATVARRRRCPRAAPGWWARRRGGGLQRGVAQQLVQALCCQPSAASSAHSSKPAGKASHGRRRQAPLRVERGREAQSSTCRTTGTRISQGQRRPPRAGRSAGLAPGAVDAVGIAAAGAQVVAAGCGFGQRELGLVGLVRDGAFKAGVGGPPSS